MSDVEPFHRLPRSVAADDALRPIDKLVYAVVFSLADRAGYCYASNQYIASAVGMSLKHVRETIARLVWRGYLVSKFDETRGNVRLLYPGRPGIDGGIVGSSTGADIVKVEISRSGVPPERHTLPAGRVGGGGIAAGGCPSGGGGVAAERRGNDGRPEAERHLSYKSGKQKMKETNDLSRVRAMDAAHKLVKCLPGFERLAVGDSAWSALSFEERGRYIEAASDEFERLSGVPRSDHSVHYEAIVDIARRVFREGCDD